MKIVFLDAKTVDLKEAQKILAIFTDVEFYEVTPPEEVISRSIHADIIITNKVILSASILEKLPKCKLICIAATGMNNVDLNYAKDHNIQVKNVSGYSTDSVVQYTFSCFFHFRNQLNYYDQFTKKLSWIDSDIFTHYQPFSELSGKRWGVIGLGEIGRSVARIAKAFGAKVNYYSTSGKNNQTEFEQVDLETLLKTSDIISIHCPLNPQTENLITKSELSLLKDHVVLINAARGGIINEKDLADSIKERNIFVALDVLTKEPMEQGSPFVDIISAPNFLLTPHIAWASLEARKKLLLGIVNNIKEYLDSSSSTSALEQ